MKQAQSLKSSNNPLVQLNQSQHQSQQPSQLINSHHLNAYNNGNNDLSLIMINNKFETND